MTLAITHTFVSGKAAGTDPTRVYGTHWDAAHTLTGTVSNAQLDDMTAATIKGRSSGSSTGDPEDLTGAQVKTILGLVASSTDNAIVRFDGTSGGTQNSGVTIDDSNNVAGAASWTVGATIVPITTYTDGLTNAVFEQKVGSIATPNTDAGATAIFQKVTGITTSAAYNANVYVDTIKTSSTDATRATGVVSTILDQGGWDGTGTATFAEAIRGEALGSVANVHLYGGLFAAVGPLSLNHSALIGVESETWNKSGTDAPVFTSYNSSQTSIAFLASNSGANKGDVGFATNSNNTSAFRTGFWATAGSIDHTAFANTASVVYGLNLENGTHSTAAIAIKYNERITFKNSGGTATAKIGTASSERLIFSGSDPAALFEWQNSSGNISLQMLSKASTVNYFQILSGATGETPGLLAKGSDTNVGVTHSTQGTGSYAFYTNAFSQNQFTITHTALAVNQLSVTGNATGSNPILSATGSDSNVGIDFQVKGTGVYRFKATSSGPTDIRLFEDTDNGTNYVSLIAPASMAADRVLTLPDATDTLVGKDTTDTFTNKSMSGSSNTFTNIPISTAISGLGTGVATALAANVGSAGAFVTFNGALGTPSSGTLTNTTGFPVANLAGAGTGVLTFLATPSSANLRAALTDETGSGGAAVFATSPTISSPTLTGPVTLGSGVTWEVVGTSSPSGASSVVFTGLSAYRTLRITLCGVASANDVVNLRLRTSTNNGSSYDSSASDYTYCSQYAIVGGEGAGGSSAGTTSLILFENAGNGSNEAISGEIYVYDFNQAKYAHVHAIIAGLEQTPAIVTYRRFGMRSQATARDAFELTFSSGNIASGYIVLEGLRG